MYTTSLNEQRKLAEALQDTSRALSSTLHYHTMLDIVLDKLSRFVPYDTSSIIMLDGRKGRVDSSGGKASTNLDQIQLRLLRNVV